jgi:hypothetical protein
MVACPSPFLWCRVLQAYYSLTVNSCLEFGWGISLLPLSSRASYTSFTVASLVHPKLPGGSLQTHLLWQSCFFKFHKGSCHSPFLQSSRHPALFAMCPFQFHFFIQFFFLRAGVRLSRRLCWFIPRVTVGILCAAYLLTCWSASPKQVRSQCLAAQEPSWFLHITLLGEVMCGLEVQEYWSFALSWWFFLPGVSPVSQQGFCFMELMLSASSL